jgi:predicted anti-sigma-YlaC factor YlaD
MSNHVTEWLNAYLDGELRGIRLLQVQEHLDECEYCQKELDSLDGLSGLLQEVPEPEFTTADRFAARVSLRLPHEQKTIYRKKLLEVGWWMAPVGLLVTWAFISTSFLISDLLSTANNLGLLTGIADWSILGSSNQVYWSSTLGQFGVLSGNSFDLVASIEALTRSSLPQIVIHVSIALLYLSWIAIWWARHRRQQHGQLLEG